MSFKQRMFAVWLVASLLWVAFSGYVFRLDHVVHRYRVHDRFMEKVAKGRQAEPFRYEYYVRGYERATSDLNAANINLALFVLMGIGLPGLVLALGTLVLQNVDKPQRRKRT